VLSQSKQAVVVTGVSSGIGAAIASHLMNQGYTVFGSVRKPIDANTLQQSHPVAFHPMIFDVRDRESIAKAVASVQATLVSSEKRLVAVVNNAGIALFGPMECLDDQGFEDTVAVNLFGTRNVTNAFLPLLRMNQQTGRDRSSQKTKGVIVNISSLSGILNTPMNGAYCVAKHAVESIGEIYRRELYGTGIDLCSIRSGPIQSDIWVKNIEEQNQYEIANYNLMSANAQSIMRAATKKALPASVVATLVQDVIERRKCKLAYEIGDGSRIAKFLSALVPTRLADRLISRALLKTQTRKSPSATN